MSVKFFLALTCVASVCAMDADRQSSRSHGEPISRTISPEAANIVAGQFGAFVKLIESDDPQKQRDHLAKLRRRTLVDCFGAIASALETAKKLKEARPDSPEQKAFTQALKDKNSLIRLCCVTATLGRFADVLLEGNRGPATPSPVESVTSPVGSTGSSTESETTINQEPADAELFSQTCIQPVGQSRD